MSVKTILKAVGGYLAVAGLVTMSLFMMEEAFQTAMFGTWPAQDAQEWRLVKQGADIMEDTAKCLITTNNWCGWIQPLAFLSYRKYGESALFYVAALRAKALAHAPELFVGETVTMTIVPRSCSQVGDHWELICGRITVISKKSILGERTVTGALGLVAGRLELEIID